MRPITNLRDRALAIGELSRSTGVNIETIRYYERIGLIEAPPRTAGGHRSYGHSHRERLKFIRRARDLGFGIDSIRTLLALASGDQNSCHDVRDIAAAHLAEVRAKLGDLTRLERILAGTIARCDAQACDAPVPGCPVLDVLQSQRAGTVEDSCDPSR